ncbi:MAG TPA: TadE family protein [Candidatus Limnocylindrales bacterium]|nr:TadE family protein [Candidatus Limnocylindrales bacterium]
MSAKAVSTERRGERGQGLVEFAVVLPIFMIMLFAILDLGRVVWANNVLGSAAREAARFAIVHGGTATNPCPVGPPGPKTVVPPASPSCPYPSPSREAIREVARQAAIAGGTPVVVTVCYGTGCVGDADTPGATNVRGTPVTVRVSSSISLVTASFLGLGSYTPVGSSTMVVNF